MLYFPRHGRKPARKGLAVSFAETADRLLGLALSARCFPILSFILQKRTVCGKMDVREFDTGVGAPPAKEKKERFFGRWLAGLRASGAVAQTVAAELLAVLFGFLLARTQILWGAIPLGVGLLCARRQRLPATGVGILAGVLTLGSAGWVYASVCLFAVVLRLLFSLPGKDRKWLPDCPAFFSERIELRVASACLAGLAAGGYQLLVGGVSDASLLFGGAMIMLCPLSCFLFAEGFDRMPAFEALIGRAPLTYDTRSGKWLFWLGGCGLCTAICFSLGSVQLFGVSLGLCLAGAVALYAARRFGPLHGLVAGLACAAAISPIYAPAYALLGLISGVLWPVGAFFALGLAAGAGAVWASFIGGLTGFLTAFPEIAVATLLSWPFLLRMGKTAEQTGERGGRRKLSGDLLSEMKAAGCEAADTRMMRLSGAFSSLSKVFGTYRTEATRPGATACGEVCSSACGKFCTGCDGYAACWEGGDAPAAAMVAAVTDRMTAGEPLGDDLLTDGFRHACKRADEVFSAVRESAGECLRTSTEAAEAEDASLEYEMVAGMLRDAVRADRVSHKEDPRLAGEVRKILRANGCRAEALSVVGTKHKTLLAAGLSPVPSEAALPKIQKELEGVFGCLMTLPVVSETDGLYTMTSTACRRYTTETAVAMRAATPDGICGDTVRFFEDSEDGFCALLSDGMGTGEAASLSSGLCGVFMEKMLSAGCTRNTAVKMLNSLLRSGAGERSTTVDMVTVDLLYGDAVFLKCGAAPSYVKRGNQLFRIRSKTIPLGLMKDPDAERVRFKVEPGDVIVMLSDGISTSPDDAAWLTTMLSADWGDASLEAMAKKILGRASTPDDATVSLIGIFSSDQRRPECVKA